MPKETPDPASVLPTCTLDSWTVTSLRDSLVKELGQDAESDLLRMFFYAVTTAGWDEIRGPVLKWADVEESRSVVAFVGTDHGITDPVAVDSMHKAGVDVRLMSAYRGVFHPKVVWLEGKARNMIWVGSNNLTKDGLLHNIEFAALLKMQHPPGELNKWVAAVESASTLFTEELLESYRDERDRFESTRARARSTTFTWSKKHEPRPRGRRQQTALRKGDFVVEIMPQETRGGTQIQVPKKAAIEFFGVREVGETKAIRLRRKGSRDSRDLVVTVFGNNTIRISINELEYRDRPCVIVFRKRARGLIEFEIVPESIFPTRYRGLLARCVHQTRKGSRRWAIG